MGMPGYSGFVPNTMLSHGLTLSRDLLLSGNASNALQLQIDKPEYLSIRAFPTGGHDGDRALRLQPNVRAMLAETEAMQGVVVDRKQPTNTQAKVTLPGMTVTICRPPIEVFIGQTKLVLSYADLRAERINEVVSQVVPQTAYWSALAGLAPERHRYAWELLGVGFSFVTKVVMGLKFQLDVPRPNEFSRLVQPVILTPGFQAFPSGHATEAYFAAEILTALIEGGPMPLSDLSGATGGGTWQLRKQLHRMAYRIAENRVVAGVHFPVDSIAGQLLGVALARHFLACCRATGLEPRPDKMSVFESAPKVDCEPMLDVTLDSGRYKMTWSDQAAVTPPFDYPILCKLWAKACKEAKSTPSDL